MSNAAEELLKKIPANGFIRTTKENAAGVSSKDRVQLVRKANEFFNQGNIEMAGRIFVHIGYGDGMIRMGDYYHEKNQFIDAMIMYHLAGDQGRLDELSERIAHALRKWINS